MIQLNHSAKFNTIAILPAINTSSPSSIILEFTQDYNNIVSYATGSVISNNNYLIVDITGSQIPTASGLYSVNMYDTTTTSGLVWSTWTGLWPTLTNNWTTYGGGGTLTTGSLINIDRAWVSGSNDVSTHQYLSGSIVLYTYQN